MSLSTLNKPVNENTTEWMYILGIHYGALNQYVDPDTKWDRRQNLACVLSIYDFSDLSLLTPDILRGYTKRRVKKAMIEACFACPVLRQCRNARLAWPEWQQWGIMAGQEGRTS